MGSYECECKANFVMNTTKNKCERKNMCHDEPCGENSKCIPRGTDNFECKCRWGYQGETESNIRFFARILVFLN